MYYLHLVTFVPCNFERKKSVQTIYGLDLVIFILWTAVLIMIFEILYGVVDPTKLRFITTHFYLSSQFHAIGLDIKLMAFEI